MSSNESKITDDHETIKSWAKERYGEPALVEGVADNSKAGGMLRINFPGHVDESLKTVSWEVFFKIFDENNLAFLYQDETIDGEQSKFCRFVDRE